MNRKLTLTARLAVLVLLLGTTSCSNSNNKSNEGADADSATVETVEGALSADLDSATIYGTSEEFGMSTFSLRDASGRLYNVTRMSEDGQDGRIYGDLEEGQQYAMTLQADTTAIDVLYNLTELRALVKDFYILNGQLVITTDGQSEVVTVEELDETHFLGTGTSGKKYEYKK